ncbi:unnamed protein product, partial [Lymnaea stagnalis]
EEIEVLEGPEVEIVGSSESGEEEGEFDMDSNKSDSDTIGLEVTRNSKQEAPKVMCHPGTEPDNKYYEVEAIIAGPKKRREHLFKLCYKVRWKGYGPEADTWQPLADLANVQDMIEDFKKEKADEAREKRKQKPPKDTASKPSSRLVSSKAETPASATSSDMDDDGQQYDPEYGTVKDKFWKDLELGRVDHYSDLFSGDMYSKIKGCQRTAHAEAVANIHKHQQLHCKIAVTSPSPFPKLVTSKALTSPRRRRYASPSSPASVKSAPSSVNAKPQSLSLSGRGRKRSCDPFSAKGYKSKRTRRSKESKTRHASTEGKRSSVSSVTSETMGIVTTTNSVLTPPVLASDKTVMHFSTAGMNTSSYSPKIVLPKNYDTTRPDCASDDDDEMSDVFSNSEEGSGRMTVSSETMLTVTTETKLLNIDQQLLSDEVFNLKTGVNGGASGSDTMSETAFEAGGATSSGNMPGSSINLEQSPRRSTLDTQSEASGAVERNHDEECLWGGACNRSDCRANRRRNMKNGKDQRKEEQGHHDKEDPEEYPESPTGHSGETAHAENQSGDTCNSPEDKGGSRLDKSCLSPAKKEDAKSPHSRSPVVKHSTSAMAPTSSGSKVSISSRGLASRFQPTGSSSLNSSPLPVKKSTCPPSQTYSSDSSFEESLTLAGNSPLSREAVKNSFGRMDALAHRMHMDTLASSSGRTSTAATAAHEVNTTMTSYGGRKNVDIAERPGLFSDSNSAFHFARQDSGFSGGSSTPGDHHIQFPLASPSGSINLSSPGKENFGSATSDATVSLSSTRDRLHHMEVDLPDARHETTTAATVQSTHSQSRAFGEAQETWSRKRASDVPQPLEKIPSPNSRRDSDLDRRIGTLTCDELDDFVEQGDERLGSKDVGFVTNADLLQAVNLSKAEVVKRAVRQSGSTDRRLDFEQPDNTGLTLLMRAVQKGTVAIVEMLLEYGVNVNAQQTNGTTALMMAAEQNGVCLLALLLKHGANSSLFTVHSDQAETALMKAIKRQHREVVNLMLRVGVNIAAPTCTSISALELAIERRNPQIEGIVRSHYQRLEQAFRGRVLATLEETAELMDPLFPLQCFPLRESQEFVVKFNSNIHPVAQGEGFLLFIAHTKINDKGVRCRFHGGCPIRSVTLNGVVQSPLTKEVNFVTSCHPIIPGCNTLAIHKLEDYTSKVSQFMKYGRVRN